RVGERAGVESVSPYVTLQSMLGSRTNLVPAVVRGIVPDEEHVISEGLLMMDDGRLDALEPGARQLILGRTLAGMLGVRNGDTLNVLVPRVANGQPTAALFGFTVAGVFDAGVPDHNMGLALTHVEDASILDGLRGRPGGIAVRLDDALAVRAFRSSIADLLEGGKLSYSDWTEEHASHCTAIRVEKTMMTIILMFIVGVAAFNIVASLMMVVTEKKRAVAILRTAGLEPGRVARIFFVQGTAIGLAGTLAGTALGLALAFNVDVIVPW